MNVHLGIIDYGAGNLHSVRNTFSAAGGHARFITTPADMDGLTHLVLPGVGSFGNCAAQLRRQRLEESIRTWIARDRPFLGICIGYQILFEEGDESPGTPGLGILRGRVRRFEPGGLKVPHMGWNSVSPTKPNAPLWRGLDETPWFYFVHSFYPEPADRGIIAAACTYGETFAAAIQRGNLVATQFHPEKSQDAGVQFLENFLMLEGR